MEVLTEYGKEDLAKVYVAYFRNNKKYLVEFVESIQPPLPREQKWVLIVSTLFGCPVGCKMCDAGGYYKGRLSSDEILEEIDYIVKKRYPDRRIHIPNFKIQFARMGDPLLNSDVLNVLETLPIIYDAPGLTPSISTVAPKNSEKFLNRLLEIKNKYYTNGRFQMQFSIHTTDISKRDELIPIQKMGFNEIAEYGNRFFTENDKKITLNFAISKGYPVNADVIRRYFDPDRFIIKLTPINPTEMALCNNLHSEIDAFKPYSADPVIREFYSKGFDVILSIGEVEENKIGSNCGQFISRMKETMMEMNFN